MLPLPSARRARRGSSHARRQDRWERFKSSHAGNGITIIAIRKQKFTRLMSAATSPADASNQCRTTDDRVAHLQIAATVAAEPVTMQDLLNPARRATESPSACRYTRSGSSRRPTGQRRTGAFRVAASTAPVIRIRAPAANSISIAPQAPEGAFLGPFNLAFHATPYRR